MNRRKVGNNYKIRNRAQAILEFALVLTIVIIGLVAMSAYFRRGVCGRLRDLSDQMGPQYDPQATGGTYRVTADSSSHTESLMNETPADPPLGLNTNKTVETNTTINYEDETRDIHETVQ